MKISKRNVFFGCVGVSVCLVAALIFILNFNANRKYDIRGNIASASVASSLDGLGGSEREPLQTSDKDELDVLLKCIKKVRTNNKYRIKGIEVAPISYDITVTFQGGQSRAYEYKVYQATKCNNPFEEFYELFE